MPFVKPENRKSVDSDVRLADSVGDITYAVYKVFMTAWKAERRWKTAHMLFKNFVMDVDWAMDALRETKFTRPDIVTAVHLAWQVFFEDEVMPYEREMKAKNGPVEVELPPEEPKNV